MFTLAPNHVPRLYKHFLDADQICPKERQRWSTGNLSNFETEYMGSAEPSVPTIGFKDGLMLQVQLPHSHGA